MMGFPAGGGPEGVAVSCVGVGGAVEEDLAGELEQVGEQGVDPATAHVARAPQALPTGPVRQSKYELP